MPIFIVPQPQMDLWVFANSYWVVFVWFAWYLSKHALDSVYVDDGTETPRLRFFGTFNALDEIRGDQMLEDWVPHKHQKKFTWIWVSISFLVHAGVNALVVGTSNHTAYVFAVGFSVHASFYCVLDFIRRFCVACFECFRDQTRFERAQSALDKRRVVI